MDKFKRTPKAPIPIVPDRGKAPEVVPSGSGVFAGMRSLTIGEDTVHAKRITFDGENIVGYGAGNEILFQFNGVNDLSGFKLDDGLPFDEPKGDDVSELKSVTSAMLGSDEADDLAIAKQLRRCLEIFAQSLPEETALEIPDMYPKWEVDKNYVADSYVRYGVNADGETQIYRIIKDHTSQADWTPDVAASLFKAVGFTDDGVSVWVQPLGAHDAYELGDIVEHKGERWESTVNGNSWEPGVVPNVWRKVT